MKFFVYNLSSIQHDTLSRDEYWDLHHEFFWRLSVSARSVYRTFAIKMLFQRVFTDGITIRIIQRTALAHIDTAIISMAVTI